MSKLINDYAQVEISNKVEDIFRMYHSSSWHSEPYHPNQNPSERWYRTIKAWTTTILDTIGAPGNCWLFCKSYVCYLLNHISCDYLKGQIPLTNLCGVTPDTSIIMMYTFYQSVYYASHNQSFPPVVKNNMPSGLVLVNMSVMLSPTNSWTSPATRSFTDLLFIKLMRLIPTTIYSQILGSQWDLTNPNPSHLLNPIRILTNLSANPWLNIIQMTS